MAPWSKIGSSGQDARYQSHDDTGGIEQKTQLAVPFSLLLLYSMGT